MLTISNVSKSFSHQEKEVEVLKNITANISDGEFVTIFGPNGSGKSTFLYLLAGLERPSKGEILGYENSSKHISTGFVFQNYNDSLLPWKTILENVTIVLLSKGVSLNVAEERSLDILREIGLSECIDKYPHQVSGGMKQLTAIARAFVMEPGILLLDEPTSSLDYSTTRMVQKKILELWEKTKITTICVSHDPDEAILLADRILIFSSTPGIIKEEITIDLPRPRSLETLISPAFMQYRQKVIKSFEE